MNILFPHWKSFGVEDITEAFEKLGHTVIQYENELTNIATPTLGRYPS